MGKKYVNYFPIFSNMLVLEKNSVTLQVKGVIQLYFIQIFRFDKKVSFT